MKIMSEQIDNTVQDWVSTWPKSDTLTDYERTLIIGNLNGFYAWLKERHAEDCQSAWRQGHAEGQSPAG